MFLSVSCFAALNPNDSENATGDAPILATKGERDLMSIEAMETLEHT